MSVGNPKFPTVPSGEGFRCEVKPERERVRVRPKGALDLSTAPVLDAELTHLRDAGFDRLLIDLRDLSFLDSSGLRLILEWNAAAGRNGCSIELVPGPPAVQRIFELTDTVSRLPFVRS